MKIVILLLAAYRCLFANDLSVQKPFITLEYQGQLGNQMFQTAAAYSLALDNHCSFIIPRQYKKSALWELQENLQHIFWRIPIGGVMSKVLNQYEQPAINNYEPIPYKVNFCIKGFFESEKYFKHHEKEIRELFAPSLEIVTYLYDKYTHIMESDNTVGIHVRTYYYDWLKSKRPYEQDGIKKPLEYLFSMLPAPDITFYEKAISCFPEDYEFIVFSDYIPWTKKFLAHIPRKFTFIENEKQYHDLYLLSFCKHQIFSNSTFAWWGAYLNSNPNKTVIVKYPWTYVKDRNIQDIIPEGWLLVMGHPNPKIPDYE